MTKQEVIDYISNELQVPVTEVSRIVNSFNKVLDFVTESSASDVIPDWNDALTFQTDGSDAGKFCIHSDTSGKKRIFETKIDDNIDNEPPTDPEQTENSAWVEISQSAGSSIREYSPGLFGAGLVITFHDHSVDGPGLYKLNEPARPFVSADIEAEILTGKWERIGVPTETDSAVHDTDVRYFEQWDWIWNFAGSPASGEELPLGWVFFSSGTGAAFETEHDSNWGGENAIGLIKLMTGTTSAGGSSLNKGSTCLRIGRGNTIRFRTRIAMPTLSDGTDSFSVVIGIGDAALPAYSFDSGIGFRYTHSENGGRWEAFAGDISVETAIDTGVSADDNFNIFEIEVAGNGNSAVFKINGTEVATITTDLPSNRNLGITTSIKKSAGTNDRSLSIDWYDLLITRSTPR